MSAMGNMIQQLMEQMRQRQAGGGMQGAPVNQPGVSPAQQSFMQRYGGGQNVTMSGGGPQTIPQSMGNQVQGGRFNQRMQQYMPQQDPYGSYGGTFGGPSGRQQGGKMQMPMGPYGTFGMGGGGQRPGMNPQGPHARLASSMTGGLRQMMNQKRIRSRNQPTGGGKGGGTLTRRRTQQPTGGGVMGAGRALGRKSPTRGGSRRGLGGLIKKRPRNQGPIKGGLLGSSATKKSQRGAFEGVLR